MLKRSCRRRWRLAKKGADLAPLKTKVQAGLKVSAPDDQTVVMRLSRKRPVFVFAEAALSFIGIGAAPPPPSLGILIAEHFEFARVQWTELAFPIGLLAVLFLAF